MALINCPECSNQVSDAAFKCPSCGTQLRKPKRGFFGKIIKFAFLSFNALMLLWMIAGYNSATSDMNTLSGAEQAGAAIGTGIGMAMVLTFWFLGTVILGIFVLLTRPKAA